LNNQGNVVAAQHKFATKSEWDLIKAVQDGDKQAYNRLYQAYIGQVYGLCYRLTGEKMLAEDAAQEVFIQLWRKIGNFNGDSKFSTWLHTVTSNITISYIRKQKGWLQKMFNIEDSVAVLLISKVMLQDSQRELELFLCYMQLKATAMKKLPQ
jgi:RNA polymerase sigma-70 factor (ECF subfamily)